MIPSYTEWYMTSVVGGNISSQVLVSSSCTEDMTAVFGGNMSRMVFGVSKAEIADEEAGFVKLFIGNTWADQGQLFGGQLVLCSLLLGEHRSAVCVHTPYSMPHLEKARLPSSHLHS